MDSHRDYFKYCLIFSAALHVGVFSFRGMHSQPAVFSVQTGPTSIEVVLVDSMPSAPPSAPVKPHSRQLELDIPEDRLSEDAVVKSRKHEKLPYQAPESVAEPRNSINLSKAIDLPQIFTEEPDRGSMSVFDPNFFQNPAPPYPPLAREKGWEGIVELKVRVLRDGKPSDVSIHKSSGYSVLDNAAVRAVQDWEFTAARKGKNLISSWVVIPVQFRLLEP